LFNKKIGPGDRSYPGEAAGRTAGREASFHTKLTKIEVLRRERPEGQSCRGHCVSVSDVQDAMEGRRVFEEREEREGREGEGWEWG